MLRDILVHSDKRCLSLALALLIIGSSLPAYAAGERPDINAGTITDSVKDRKTVIPPVANVKIEVNKDQEETPAKKEGYRLKVNGIRIIGQTIYSEDKLQTLVKDTVGQEVTLSELESIAGRIAHYFNERGYMVADAYLPAQKITNGIVEIAVVPGRYGSVEIRNHSKLSTKAANRLLGAIKPGDYVKKDVLERTLLLLNDTGGISIKATLAPGKTSGTTNLIVEINDNNTLTSEFSMDNYGNRYAGQYRGNLNLHLNNISCVGDIVNIGGNTGGNTDGSTHNIDINYLLPVGQRGAKLGAGYSRLHYTVGREFGALDFYGTARTTSIFANYPLLRFRNHNLNFQIDYEHRQLKDNTYGFTASDRHANVWTLGLYGDSRDNFHGGGANSYALNIATGHLDFDGGRDENNISAATHDRETAGTAGTYTKATLNFNRLQYLNNRLNFYFSFTGQLASKNLDSAEKLFLGGGNGVRAYTQGEASGDQGYLVTGELRWNMPTPAYQLAFFIDNGRVTVKDPWPAITDAKSTSLTGAGLGVIISTRRDYSVRLDYAWKIGSGPANSSSDKNGRWWLKGTRYF